MQFGFMAGQGTVDAIFIVRMQEEYQKNEKLCMCFVGTEKLVTECQEKSWSGPSERSSIRSNGSGSYEHV